MIELRGTPLASRAWRLQNLYTIKDADGKLVPFKPNAAQRKFYNERWYLNHVLKARKLGFSTLFEVENLDALLFTPHLTAGIVDYTIEDAKKKLQMVKTAYHNLDNRAIHPETWKIGEAIKGAVKIASTTKQEIVFANGSSIYCGTSLRGATPQRLHVSELGKTAAWAPIKAKEINEGALNSITPGNRVDIESTHEGGRAGLHYDLLQVAMRNDPAKLTKNDFKFHFFPWWEDPRYRLDDPVELRPEMIEYFERMARETGHQFDHAQMLWYDRKQQTQKHGMKKEFPTTPGEAFEAIANAAIYGREMADLRAKGRICDFVPETHLPMFTFWDLGLSDFGVQWLIQPVGRAFLALDWHEVGGLSAAGHADQMRRWEQKYERPIAMHFLPHDADTRDRGTGKSYRQCLEECGMKNVRVVPRTPDIWNSIGYVRDVLPHFWFHKTNCDSPRSQDGEDHPSGVACLEGYSKHLNPAGTTIKEMPKHDLFSHSADAFRTFSEAWRLGIVEGSESPANRPRAIGSPRARR